MKRVLDEVRSRFDSYDFFALWGGGIVVLTYIFCMMYFLLRNKIFSVFGVASRMWIFLSENVLIAFLFISIIAYCFGLILHELGRWFFDAIGNVFQCERVSDLYSIPDKKKLKRANALFRSNKYARQLCKKRIKNFERDFKKIHSDIELDDAVSAFYMETFLKSKGVAVGKRYSAYGLARSIFIGSILNDVLLLLPVLRFGFCVHSVSSWFVIIVSLIVTVSMYGRTYKSYLAYIRNLYAAFYMAKAQAT